jgi:hypothetical protein
MKPCFRKSTRYSVDYYYKEILKHFYIFLYYLLEKGKDFEIKLVDDSGKISEQLINAQKLKKDNKDTVDFKKLEEEITELAAKVTKENSISLSSYILFRKYVLNLFKEALNVYKDSCQYNEKDYFITCYYQKIHLTILIQTYGYWMNYLYILKEQANSLYPILKSMELK